MECFLPTCSEDRVDSPDPGHSARRVLSPAEARRGWVTFGRGTTSSGRRRKASGPPGCWWPAASPHVSGGRGRRRRACPCGRLGRRRVLRVSCALRSVHHLPAAAPPGPAGTAACRCRPEDSPAGGAWGTLPEARASLLDLMSLLPRRWPPPSVNVSGNAVGGRSPPCSSRSGQAPL